MIPQIIHSMWVGPDPEPTQWTDTWRAVSERPGWEYKLWTEENIDQLPMQNREFFDYYMREGAYSGAYNVFHGEVLWEYGGWVVGADIELTDPEGFLAHPMHKTRFTTSVNEVWFPKLFSNVVGAIPQHPIIGDYRNILSEQWENKNIWPPWKHSGARQLTQAMHQHVRLVPMKTFARTYFGVPVRGHGDNLGESHMYTTKKLQSGELPSQLADRYTGKDK